MEPENLKSIRELGNFLDIMVDKYNRPNFIEKDPISIPRLFTKKQDIEIMGLWASMLAWGQRVTIINKCKELIDLMDGSPYEFITQHSEQELKRFEKFKHRTFNYTDTLYFIYFFKWYYSQHDTLETGFLKSIKPGDTDIKNGLIGFHNLFFSLEDHPNRTKKHIPTPDRKSACKRINMFLRWMVRQDDNGVDFGIWQKIKPSMLVCPCDLHVDRVGRKLGLITRKNTDWETAIELTANLKRFDPNDPVKYDFALFGLGIEEKY
jgi:uncharacterized protein (TIGR02757 family)